MSQKLISTETQLPLFSIDMPTEDVCAVHGIKSNLSDAKIFYFSEAKRTRDNHIDADITSRILNLLKF